jgi:hypothetical protein
MVSFFISNMESRWDQKSWFKDAKGDGRKNEYLAIGYDNGTVVFLNQRNE